MTRSLPFDVGNLVLCEDIRPGPYGRQSLLGVYSGDIIVDHLGGYIRVAIYGEVFGHNLNDIDAELTVLYVGREIVKMRTGFRFQNLHEPCLLVVAPFQIVLSDEGDITVEAVSRGITKTLMTKRVRVGELSLVPSPRDAENPPRRETL
jgi:hypothetical protein